MNVLIWNPFDLFGGLADDVTRLILCIFILIISIVAIIFVPKNLKLLPFYIGVVIILVIWFWKDIASFIGV